MARIWEKRSFCAVTKVWSLIMHNVNAVIAIDLKPCMTILQRLCYARCIFCVMPTFSTGIVITSITHSWKICCIVPHFRSPPFQVKRWISLVEGWNAYEPRIKPMIVGIFECWLIESCLPRGGTFSQLLRTCISVIAPNVSNGSPFMLDLSYSYSRAWVIAMHGGCNYLALQVHYFIWQCNTISGHNTVYC